jgi:glycosyltransferase involved in cell wall biosynthesis
MEAVSILIPCHNNEAWISKAIDSALAQSHPAHEVIVLDDGSTDGSLDIIKSYDARVRWESTTNRGGNAARNHLLSLATGDWIQFLDADDYLKPDKIEQQFTLIEPGVDAIYGSVTLEFWNDGELAGEEISTVDPSRDIYTHWFNWQLAQTGAVLWRADALRGIGGWNEAFPCCQDNELCLRALEAGLAFRLSADAGAVYRIWSGGTVSRKNPQRLVRVKTELLDRMIDWLSRRGELENRHVEMAAAACFRMARSLAADDLANALPYVKERRKKGCFLCPRSDVPLPYYLLYKMLGFRAAEWGAFLSRQTRNIRRRH